MGMLDVLKRWFGGGKPQPAKTVRPTPAAPVTRPVAPATPIPAEPVAATTAQPIVPVAVEAPEDAQAKIAQSFVERRVKPRVNARDGTRVLIIDDSPTIVALLKRMLEQSGYKTLDAGDADTGLHLALSEVPDLIFLDIVLPGMNGFEALRRLRRDPISKTIPVVMISGNELATEQFYAQRIGADDFMKKPFARSEVFVRIEKLLDAEKVPRRHLAVVTAVPTAPVPATPAPVAAVPKAITPVAVEAPAAPVVEAAPPAISAEPVAAAPATPVEATVEAATPAVASPVSEASIPASVEAEAVAEPTQLAEEASVEAVEPAVIEAAVIEHEVIEPAVESGATVESAQDESMVAAPAVEEITAVAETGDSEPVAAPMASVTSIAPPPAPMSTLEATVVDTVQPPVAIAAAVVAPPVIAATNAPAPVQQAASS